MIVKLQTLRRFVCSSSERRHHQDYGAASASPAPGFVWRPFKHQCYSNLWTVVEGGSAVNSPIWELCRWEERMSCHLAPPSTLVPPRCSHYVHSGWAGHSWLIMFNYINCYVLHTTYIMFTYHNSIWFGWAAECGEYDTSCSPHHVPTLRSAGQVLV